MFPAKGAHLELNEKYLAWMQGRLIEIEAEYSDENADDDKDAVLDAMLEYEGWAEEKDNFGRKVFAATPYKEGELRITVVHTKRGEIRLDIREWFEGK